MSLRTGKPIAAEFAARLPITAALLFGGGAIVLALSLALGIAGAISNGGLTDRALHAVSLVGASTPSFLVAALLVFVVFFVLTNAATDLLCFAVDPRIRRIGRGRGCREFRLNSRVCHGP